MAGFAGGVEDDVGPAVAEADAFGFIDQVGDIAAEDDPLSGQVDHMDEKFVGSVAVGQIGVVAADNVSLPDVDSAVQPLRLAPEFRVKGRARERFCRRKCRGCFVLRKKNDKFTSRKKFSDR